MLFHISKALCATVDCFVVPPRNDDSVSLDNLPDPDVLAEEIAENLESALGSFKMIIEQLKK